jgi:hypothetical protein
MEGQLEYLMIRVFNCYGPRLRGRVLDRFIDASIKGEPLQIHGDGSQTRCFTYVDDLVDGIVRLLTTPSASNQVYNIGNPVHRIASSNSSLTKRPSARATRISPGACPTSHASAEPSAGSRRHNSTRGSQRQSPIGCKNWD